MMFDRIKEKLDLNKPTALGWGEWDEWHKNAKTNQPVAYFIMETIPDKWDDLYKAVTKPWKNTRDWIRYRAFDRYHVIHTRLKPDYYEIDTRMLHGMFELLVDFVEVQSAWMHVIFDDQSKYNNRPWWSKGWSRFKSFRDPAAGLDHLKWEMTLDSENLPSHERNPGQAEMARAVWELYHWWKYIRPIRPDPHAISGWSEYCRNKSTKELFGDQRDKEEQKRSMEIIDRSNEIERAYEQEDEDMLIRLVKLRRSLWT